jgi:RNA polymerase sigma factor (sigma-70 family)
MKGAFRKDWNTNFAKPARRRLIADLKSLSLYCQPPDPRAKGALGLREAMKERTQWPDFAKLQRIEDDVIKLALIERERPSGWKAFKLVNRRHRRLQLVKHISDLATRARERLEESGFSRLEAMKVLSWGGDPAFEKQDRELQKLFRDDKEGQKLLQDIALLNKKDAEKLLRDIQRVKENPSAARTIDWSQHALTLVSYEIILSRFPGYGSVAYDKLDTALGCYARSLELLIGHAPWEKLRRQAFPLVFWLWQIGYPDIRELSALHYWAALTAIDKEEAEIQREREAKLAKFQQSKRIIKKTKEDIEDDRLMEQVRQGSAQALGQLRNRHQGTVKKTVRAILRGNSAVDDIVSVVFAQVWKAARTYVPIAKFTTWLAEIAKNCALNEKERTRKEKERAGFAYVSEHGSRGSQKTSTGGSAEFSGSPGEDSDEASGLSYIAEDDGTEAEGFEESASEADDGKSQALSPALNRLSPLKRRIMEARFPMDGSKPKDRQALAKQHGITVSQVEDLERDALSELREFMSP